ncbi:hypothetical protein [Xanthomonas phage JGB6]|nr:hypothetical protein [Xanthomonas phage JGB6]
MKQYEAEVAAKRAYEDHVNNNPHMHSNRFPSWNELSETTRQDWIQGTRK